MYQPFPILNPDLVDSSIEKDMWWLQQLNIGIRNIRGEWNSPPAERVKVFYQPTDNEHEKALYESSASAVFRLSGVDEFRPLVPADPIEQMSTLIVDEKQYFVQRSIKVDVDAELARLEKRQGKVRQDLAKSEAKLANENFVRNAPAEVIAQERTRVEEFKRELAQLAEQHERVASLR